MGGGRGREADECVGERVPPWYLPPLVSKTALLDPCLRLQCRFLVEFGTLSKTAIQIPRYMALATAVLRIVVLAHGASLDFTVCFDNACKSWAPVFEN